MALIRIELFPPNYPKKLVKLDRLFIHPNDEVIIDENTIRGSNIIFVCNVVIVASSEQPSSENSKQLSAES